MRLTSVLMAALLAAGLLWVHGCNGGDSGKKTGPGPTTQPAGGGTGQSVGTGDASKPPPGMVALPLKLPAPRFSGTPKNVPPGTRVKITTGPVKPRPDFYAPPGVANVAAGKPVTASDTNPVIGKLSFITDGNKEANEDAYVELGPNVQWVQVDLGRKYKIYAVVVWHEHKNPVVYHDVVIQTAKDKDFIEGIQTIYNNDHDNTAGQGIGEEWGYYETNEGLLVDAKGVVSQFIRLHSNGSTGDDLNRYTEVEVYAMPAD